MRSRRMPRLAFLGGATVMASLAVGGLVGEAAAQASPDARSDTAAVGTRALLYTGVPYGSEATFSPLSVALNLGFEDFQRRQADRRIFDFPYKQSAKGVWDAVSNVGEVIDRYGGWRLWVGDEILPLATGRDRAGWWPNWTTHMIGGGLQTRMLTEWWAAQGVPAPSVWAGINFLAISYLHEMTQHPGQTLGSGSTTADLLVFDIPAAILSNWDGPVRFFAVKLQAANWSPMGTITFPNREITNHGDYWVYKIPLPDFFRGSRLFWRVGYGAQWGLSIPVAQEHTFSFGLGVDTRDRTLDPTSLREAITLAFSGGVYFDRNNSLLVSLNFSQRQWEPFTLNVYPGVLPGALEELGVWAKIDWEGQFRMGIQHRKMLGVGIGYGRGLTGS